jgi:Tfp pilus assembly protein PilN
MTEEQIAQLQDSIQTLRFLLTGLYVLVGLVAVYLGWGLRKVAKNQVDAARLLEQATARLEKDIGEQGG